MARVRSRVAIVLAAGAGERMGESKALLVVDGRPLARAHVERAHEAGCDRVVVVTRPDVALRLGEIPRATVIGEVTPSQADTLAVAVRRIGMRGDVAVLICPVDHPPVSIVTLWALFDALDAGAEVATPQRAKKGGHPVACRAHVLSPYAASGPAPVLRDVLAVHEAGRARVEVDDPRVGIDLDTPDDVRAFTGSPPKFLM
jgi:molybdenum cofactor cytidylyltransferase